MTESPRDRIATPVPFVASSRAALLWFLAIAVLLLFTFTHNEHCLSSGFDGEWYRVMFDYEALDRTPFAQTGVDALSGSFDAYYPLQREYLLPNAIAMLLGEPQLSRGATYFAYSLALLLAIYAVGRAVGVERPVALTGGFLMVILAPPGFVNYPSQFYHLFELNPQWFETTTLACLIVAAFWALDGRGSWRTALLIPVPLVCFGVSVLAVAPQVILSVPAIALYGGASLLSVKSWRDDRWRLLAGALMLGVPLLLGVGTYYYSLINYTAYRFFADEITHPLGGKVGLSSYFGAPLAHWTIVLGVVGAAGTVLMASGKLRLLAVAHLIATALFFLIGSWFAFSADEYRGSFPVYFETAFWPYATLFAVLAIAGPARLAFGVIGLFAGRLTKSIPYYASSAVLAAALAWVTWNNVAAARTGAKDCKGWTTPPIHSTAITDYLEKAIALAPGTPFRGIVATIGGFDEGKPADWIEMAGSTHRLWTETGSDHRLDGLWQFNIPTLFQYQTFITPPYYLLLTDFLARSTDRQLRSVVVMSKIDAPMMRLWGVRYLITDSPTDAGKEVAALPTRARGTLHLTELNGANLGDYSPTEVRLAGDFHAGLQIMHEPGFDGTRQVVTDSPIGANLVPAAEISLVYEKYGFHVVGKSAGQSVLVLPVQYSHCWTAEAASAEAKPADATPAVELFRADLMQLGLRFSGNLDARLVFRFGPLLAARCRLADLNDMTRLHIEDARSAEWRAAASH